MLRVFILIVLNFAFMNTILLCTGITLIIIGWLTLSWFAIKQINAQKEYEKFPQKREEIKSQLNRARWISRTIILIGMCVLAFTLLL